MSLPCLLAAPTVVTIGGAAHLARPLSLGDLAALVRGAGDALARDVDAGDCPRFAEPEFIDWMAGPGLPLLAWCALRRDRPGLTLDGAAGLVASAASDEAQALVRAAFRRAGRSGRRGGRGLDISEHDWAAVVYGRYAEGCLPAALAELTPDQADAIASRGKPDGAAAALALEDAQSIWEREHAGKIPPPPPGPTTVEDHGYRFDPADAPTPSPTSAGAKDEGVADA